MTSTKSYFFLQRQSFTRAETFAKSSLLTSLCLNDIWKCRHMSLNIFTLKDKSLLRIQSNTRACYEYNQIQSDASGLHSPSPLRQLDNAPRRGCSLRRSPLHM